MGGRTDPTITAMAGRYVTAIRGIQAAGPYVLGGFSIGGGIAMEMAAQLTQSGDAVASVIILDGHTSLAPPPDHHKVANLITNARERGLRQLGPWAWRQVRWKLGCRHSPEMLRRLGNSDPERLGYVDCEEAIFACGRAHSLRRVDVDVLLVKSAQLWPMYPSDYGWTPYVGREFRVEVTPGDHLSMLDGPNVPALARAISRHLSRHL